jgi:lysozyme family protein
MPTVGWSHGLAEEYRQLFNTCVINENHMIEIDNILEKMERNQNRYVGVGDALSMPWHFVAVIHHMESSIDFTRHLHNGDLLTARTVHIPVGRPKTGSPPFTWEESAVDALRFHKLDAWRDWSLSGLLFKLEEYNGWGYRLYHSHVLSPYLWSGSNHYKRGKYIGDGAWSDTAVSKQIGAAVLLRRMAEKGVIKFQDATITPIAQEKPCIIYSSTQCSCYAEELQTFLNKFPGINLKVDGFPGAKTSEALKKVTGLYLLSDPRAPV